MEQEVKTVKKPQQTHDHEQLDVEKLEEEPIKQKKVQGIEIILQTHP